MLGIAGEVKAPTYAELYSGDWVASTCSGCMGQPDRQGANFMRRRSSLILRQVSPQACSATRSSSSAITVSATCAWMRRGAQLTALWRGHSDDSFPTSARRITPVQSLPQRELPTTLHALALHSFVVPEPA